MQVEEATNCKYQPDGCKEVVTREITAWQTKGLKLVLWSLTFCGYSSPKDSEDPEVRRNGKRILIAMMSVVMEKLGIEPRTFST
jgi:hypothetical protein